MRELAFVGAVHAHYLLSTLIAALRQQLSANYHRARAEFGARWLLG